MEKGNMQFVCHMTILRRLLIMQNTIFILYRFYTIHYSTYCYPFPFYYVDNVFNLLTK